MAIEPQGSEYTVSPIPTDPEAQAKRGWKWFLNGEEITDPIQTVRAFQDKMGVELVYGDRPEGFDGPVIIEPGGGGSVIIPHYTADGHLYVGMLEEKRLTMTDGQPEDVLNVPRGFLDPGIDHFEAARREFLEEKGIPPLSARLIELPGEPVNPNSAFFKTGIGRGVRIFELELKHWEILPSSESDDPLQRRFKPDPEVVIGLSNIGQKAARTELFHWKEAVKTGDMFTLGAVARILAAHPSTEMQS